MGEVHDVHQPEDQREAYGDETVEQAHQEAAREALDNGLGGHEKCSDPEALLSMFVIASEATQSILSSCGSMDCFVASLLAMTERAKFPVVVMSRPPPPTVTSLLHRPDGFGNRSLRWEDCDELAADILQQHRVGVVVLAHFVELDALPGHDGLLAR